MENKFEPIFEFISNNPESFNEVVNKQNPFMQQPEEAVAPISSIKDIEKGKEKEEEEYRLTWERVGMIPLPQMVCLDMGQSSTPKRGFEGVHQSNQTNKRPRTKESQTPSSGEKRRFEVLKPEPSKKQKVESSPRQKYEQHEATSLPILEGSLARAIGAAQCLAENIRGTHYEEYMKTFGGLMNANPQLRGKIRTNGA